ncbi:16S rRNA (cytidine(1402)-2'-O)-methyltransferase [Nesterenkonia halophila]|uniref:16S rRNA (cytidine(1402)-2'-O)-methyltransferase n=1 Tax=Nesterenkonia halophila TaxID=302044 RepID=UPI001290B0EF|nr:16S rRNA (cytidine(1402)-2'-O)-methyltransferase [Nesterenkonia halophila]
MSDHDAQDELRGGPQDDAPEDAPADRADDASEDAAEDEHGTSAVAVPAGLWDVPLVLAATPIGNLSDASPRLRALLASAEVVAAEDTRRTRHLCQALGVRPTGRLVSLHEHNEASRAAEVVERAAAGARVLVVSDAGMPAVSDPGFRLVAAAVEAGVEVTAAPGASAVPTALALSGLPTDRFTFAGFMPRKGAERRRLLHRLATEEWTTVLFESPHRTAATLAECAEQLGGGRGAAMCRELTKKHEEVLRGSLAELAEQISSRQLRGEVVLVIGGAAEQAAPSHEDLVAEVLRRAEAGEKVKAAAKEVAAAHGATSRELYDAAVAARKG